MPEYVRVLDKDTGHKRSVFASELAHGNYERLDEAAVDARTELPLEPELNAVPAEPTGYASQKKSDLEDEIETRNQGRSEDALIVVSAPGNKADLIAALEADDDAHESLSSNTPDGQLADPEEENAHG